MKFLGLGFFESIDITSSFLALKNHPTVSKSSVIAMEGYKIYYCYPAFSTYGIALDQVMFSNKLYVFFQNYTVGLGGGRGGREGDLSPLWCKDSPHSQQYQKLLSFSSYSINKTLMVYNSNIAI